MPYAFNTGFLRDEQGALVLTTSLVGAAWHAGFLRSPSGALVVIYA